MRRNQEDPVFVPGALASAMGTVVVIHKRDQDEDGTLWYFVEPFVKGARVGNGWFPLEALSEVKTVNIGFNECDETQMDPTDAEDLKELLDAFFEKNGIEEPVLDYAESIVVYEAIMKIGDMVKIEDIGPLARVMAVRGHEAYLELEGEMFWIQKRLVSVVGNEYEEETA